MEEERRIQLTDDQFERLLDCHQSFKSVPQLMADMFVRVVEESAKNERKFWESVSRLADMPHEDKGRLVVDWVCRCIIVKPHVCYKEPVNEKENES